MMQLVASDGSSPSIEVIVKPFVTNTSLPNRLQTFNEEKGVINFKMLSIISSDHSPMINLWINNHEHKLISHE